MWKSSKSDENHSLLIYLDSHMIFMHFSHVSLINLMALQKNPRWFFRTITGWCGATKESYGFLSRLIWNMDAKLSMKNHEKISELLMEISESSVFQNFQNYWCKIIHEKPWKNFRIIDGNIRIISFSKFSELLMQNYPWKTMKKDKKNTMKILILICHENCWYGIEYFHGFFHGYQCWLLIWFHGYDTKLYKTIW